MKKIYFDENGEHIFGSQGLYEGYVNYKNPEAYKELGEPFKKWAEWDEEKHNLLTNVMGFKLKEITGTQSIKEGKV